METSRLALPADPKSRCAKLASLDACMGINSRINQLRLVNVWSFISWLKSNRPLNGRCHQGLFHAAIGVVFFVSIYSDLKGKGSLDSTDSGTPLNRRE